MAHKLREVPEYDEEVTCKNPECIHVEASVLTGLYGAFGGGLGPYTMCENCGEVLTKSEDEELRVNQTEIKEEKNEQAATNVQDARSDVNVGDGGPLPSTRK